jgi:hypothetical protein
MPGRGDAKSWELRAREGASEHEFASLCSVKALANVTLVDEIPWLDSNALPHIYRGMLLSVFKF